MKYYYQIEGLIRNNIGDVLQGMVAKPFLPENALVTDREALADIDDSESALLLANGWYMHSFEKFPPPPNVTPLYLSVHVANSKLLTAKEVREHFKKHAPIGCRDEKTLKLFLGWGIPAYYSGCLTTTTTKRAEINHTGIGEVLLVDNVDHPVPDQVKVKLEKLVGASPIRVSHDPPNVSGTLEEYAQRSELHMNTLLERYCKAALVITTKIHCALPCLGMGANVMLIHPNPSDPRLATVSEFIDIISYKDILAATHFAKPIPNQEAINKRKKLLYEIVEKSVAIGGNIITSPDTIELKKIKRNSIFLARILRLGIKAALMFNLANDRIRRVYKSAC